MTNQMIVPMLDLFFAKLIKAKRLDIGSLGDYQINGLLRVTHAGSAGSAETCFLSIRTDPQTGTAIEYHPDRRDWSVRNARTQENRKRNVPPESRG